MVPQFSCEPKQKLSSSAPPSPPVQSCPTPSFPWLPPSSWRELTLGSVSFSVCFPWCLTDRKGQEKIPRGQQSHESEWFLLTQLSAALQRISKDAPVLAQPLILLCGVSQFKMWVLRLKICTEVAPDGIVEQVLGVFHHLLVSHPLFSPSLNSFPSWLIQCRTFQEQICIAPTCPLFSWSSAGREAHCI